MAGKGDPNSRGKYFMINVTLSPEDDEFLRWFGNETRRRGGYHLPKTLILRSMSRVLKELVDSGRIDLDGIFTEQDLMARLLTSLKLTSRP
jgi:hypothetical protein